MTGPDLEFELVVFSDDWGRHPSSCQHLVCQLLSTCPTLWVNTIGTRFPRLSMEDAGKIAGKLCTWIGRGRRGRAGHALLENLRVLNPVMYPGFRRNWQRGFNARMVASRVHRALPPRTPGLPRIALTTLPTTADLVGRLPVDRWVYYCVDDFSVWPGLDGNVLDRMERDLVERVDRIVAVSRTLVDRIGSMGREAALLTHGMDLSHFAAPPAETAMAAPPDWWHRVTGPCLLFWGVIDARLDTAWCLKLAQSCGTLVLVGPTQKPDPRLLNHPGIVLPGPVPYEHLPALAAACDVLVMPYADLPVTRAMQPLKFKEYLATGRPAVVRALPATLEWADAADVVADADEQVRITRQRIEEGIPADQTRARERLRDESWRAKADLLRQMLHDTIRASD